MASKRKRQAEQAEPDWGKTPQEIPTSTAGMANGELINKERVLVVPSRGVNFRYCISCRLHYACITLESHQYLLSPCRFRHLMLDLMQLLPHSKKDAKLDTKSERGVINEVAEMKVSTAPPHSGFQRGVARAVPHQLLSPVATFIVGLHFCALL
jgi:hypothetical protein